MLAALRVLTVDQMEIILYFLPQPALAVGLEQVVHGLELLQLVVEAAAAQVLAEQAIVGVLARQVKEMLGVLTADLLRMELVAVVVQELLVVLVVQPTSEPVE